MYRLITIKVSNIRTRDREKHNIKSMFSLNIQLPNDNAKVIMFYEMNMDSFHNGDCVDMMTIRPTVECLYPKTLTLFAESVEINTTLHFK